MPAGDRTGPVGMGPMTGRRTGYCAGNNAPGYAAGRGGRGGRCGGGRGFGRGTGYGRGVVYGPAPGFVPEEEKTIIARQLEALQAQAAALEERLRTLEGGE